MTKYGAEYINRLITLIQSSLSQKVNTSDISNIMDGIKNANVYSTNEVCIGEWIDGTPLYRRVIQATTPAETDIETSVWVSREPISMKNMYGSIHTGSNNYTPINMYRSADNYTMSYFDATNNRITMVVSKMALSNLPVEIILEYTKVGN